MRTLSLLIITLLAVSACTGPDRAPGEPFATETVTLDGPEGNAYTPTLDGPLRLLSASPQGTLDAWRPEQGVSVTFTRPMVPLGEAPPVPEDQLAVEPHVPGTLRWEGTQTLVFQPDEPLPVATAFEATLHGGLTAVDGSTWDQTYSWTFETPRPQVVRSQPRHGYDLADPRTTIRLYFNQAVEAGAAERYVEVRSGDASVTHELRNDGDSTLVLAPDVPLPGGSTVEIVLEPGLPSAAGPLGMKEQHVIRFQTYGEPALERLSQENRWQDDAPFHPGRSITLHFTTPVRFGVLRRALAFEPAVEWPEGVEVRDDTESRTHALPLDFAPETRYRLTVDSLNDVFGQTLGRASRTFRTRAYEPILTMPRGLLVIEAQEQRAVPMRATNVSEVHAGLRALAPGDVVPLLADYGPRFYGRRQDMTDSVTLDRTIVLDVERNRPTTVPLELDSLLGPDRTGAVAVRIQQASGNNRQEYRALAVVTRLGITAKFSPHQNLIFATDLQTAEPIPNARVTIRSDSNRVLWSGRTGNDGRAVTPGWAELGLEQIDAWTQPTQYVFVEEDGDFAFTSSAYDDGIEPYRFGVDIDWSPEPERHAGSVFSDRGLYRAGDSVFVKAVLRRGTDGDWQAVRDSVRVLVNDPRDRLVHDAHVLPSGLGTFDFAWQAPPSGAQGQYEVRVVAAGDTAAVEREPWEPGDLARGTFRVDAFRRATFAVTARASADSYVAGDFFEGSITGRYLFGAAMQDQSVTYSLTRQNGFYEPAGYPGYRFGHFDQSDVHREIARADTVLDGDGRIDVRVPLPGDAGGRTTQLQWTGRVTDPARQEIAATETYTLHPGLFYVGVKPQTTFLDLSEDDEIDVRVITVDPAGQPVATGDVEVTLIREQWHSVREVGADGGVRWRSERVEEVMGRQTVGTERGRATRLVMPVDEGGRYVIRAEARDVRGNAIRTDAYFYATGRGYVAWQRTDDDRIDLQADATLYRPGETARIMVQSPYEEATALVTVEREGILESRVQHVTGSAPQIEVSIEEAYLPNVFVSVILLNGRTAEPGPPGDPGAPSFKIGYTELHVSPEQRHLIVEVEPDQERYRPGDAVTVDLRLRDQDGRGVPGEIAFSAADAGVLDLIDYALPDPFDAFYGPRPLGVRTAETLAHLVRQRTFGQKSEDLGGGGGNQGGDAMMREDFRALAHWAPALRTDEHGRATVTFRLPESLTTFRLMAAAVGTEQRFGRGQTDVLVTQPLVMQPALPRFARPGDTFEAGVLVTNTTGAAGRATVTAEAEGLVLMNETQRSVRLPDGATQEVRFRWRADATGTARITFEAQLGNKRDALTTTLPVTLPPVKHVSGTFASTEGSAKEALQIPADRVPGLGRFQARLSSTALVGLDGAAQHLFDYPYGCLEQRTSRVRPLLLAGPLLEAFDLSVLEGNHDRVVEDWLQDLDDFWTGAGFTMWPGADYTNPYVTAYTVLALAEARDAGYRVPADLTRQAVDVLAGHIRRRSERPEYYDASAWNDTRALMLFALARHGRTLAAEIDALAQEPGSMSVEGTSLLLRTIEHADEPALARYRETLLRRLRDRLRVEATRAYLVAPDDAAHRWIFASDTRATAHGLTALAEVDPTADTQQLGERMVRYLMDTRRGGHWSSTQDNAVVIDAFRAYFEAFENEVPDFAATVSVAGREILDAVFRGRSFEVAEEMLSAADLPPGERLPVTIDESGTGRTYYTLRLETYSTESRAAANQGLSVARTLQRLDDRGQPVGETMTTGRETVTLEPGQLVRVTVRVAAPTDLHYVAVDDALPAGLEPVNAAFATVDQSVLDEAGAGPDRWWGSFNHTEMHDDRVLLFADLLRRGAHTYTYVARATTPGTFVHPTAQAEEMYSPETRGHTADGTLVVRNEPGP